MYFVLLNKKKILALFLGLSITFVIFAGCNKTPAKETESTTKQTSSNVIIKISGEDITDIIGKRTVFHARRRRTVKNRREESGIDAIPRNRTPVAVGHKAVTHRAGDHQHIQIGASQTLRI